MLPGANPNRTLPNAGYVMIPDAVWWTKARGDVLRVRRLTLFSDFLAHRIRVNAGANMRTADGDRKHRAMQGAFRAQEFTSCSGGGRTSNENPVPA
jgi:hypothetical protein